MVSRSRVGAYRRQVVLNTRGNYLEPCFLRLFIPLCSYLIYSFGPVYIGTGPHTWTWELLDGRDGRVSAWRTMGRSIRAWTEKENVTTVTSTAWQNHFNLAKRGINSTWGRKVIVGIHYIRSGGIPLPFHLGHCGFIESSENVYG